MLLLLLFVAVVVAAVVMFVVAADVAVVVVVVPFYLVYIQHILNNINVQLDTMLLLCTPYTCLRRRYTHARLSHL